MLWFVPSFQLLQMHLCESVVCLRPRIIITLTSIKLQTPRTESFFHNLKVPNFAMTSWSSGQSLWLLIMRSRVRFPALPWEFTLKGKIPAVTMVWVD